MSTDSKSGEMTMFDVRGLGIVSSNIYGIEYKVWRLDSVP
jgi:hypothetical protein